MDLSETETRQLMGPLEDVGHQTHVPMVGSLEDVNHYMHVSRRNEGTVFVASPP